MNNELQHFMSCQKLKVGSLRKHKTAAYMFYDRGTAGEASLWKGFIFE